MVVEHGLRHAMDALFALRFLFRRDRQETSGP